MKHQRAVGFLRSDVSGMRHAWDEREIASTAKRLGFELRALVIHTAETSDSIWRLCMIAERHKADAVIVPSLGHFASDTVPAKILEETDVVTVAPEHRYRASSRSKAAQRYVNFFATSPSIECGHRIWGLLHGGLEVAAAGGATRMGTEHLLLQMLRDPSAIPAEELQAMGLDPSIVFARLASLARKGDR